MPRPATKPTGLSRPSYTPFLYAVDARLMSTPCGIDGCDDPVAFVLLLIGKQQDMEMGLCVVHYSKLAQMVEHPHGQEV